MYKKYYFQGYRGIGTWPLTTMVVSTDTFNATSHLIERDGWHDLRLLSVHEIEDYQSLNTGKLS